MSAIVIDFFEVRARILAHRAWLAHFERWSPRIDRACTVALVGVCA